jgi:uncharacterized membrane protein (DUF2068 family)
MSSVGAEPITTGEHESSRTLLLIALFKLVKGILLVAVGIGALGLLHRDVANTVLHWVGILRLDPDNRLIHSLLIRVVGINSKQLEALSAGTFIYAGVFLTEGTGLLLRKRWAEYFTIITTAGLIPLELYEIGRHVSAGKVIILALNVVVVVYLVMRVRMASRCEGR